MSLYPRTARTVVNELASSDNPEIQSVEDADDWMECDESPVVARTPGVIAGNEDGE